MAKQNGQLLWLDLTVEDADGIRDFYREVIGWQSEAVEVDDYHDYNMTQEGEPIAGISWKRGVNAKLPPVWMVYLGVEDLDASLATCQRLGGQVLVAPSDENGHTYAVIQDPAGAICALYLALDDED